MAKQGFIYQTGDPYVYQELTGATSASMGIDSADSDKFKISVSASPGVTPSAFTQIKIDPVAGDITLNPDLGTVDVVGLFSVSGTSNMNNIILGTTKGIKTDNTATNTFLLQAFNTNTSSYTTFVTFTAGNPPTCDLNSSVTIGGDYIYRAGGTKVAIADGGTNNGTYNTDGIIYYDGTKLTSTTVGTATYVLTSNGAGMAPTFQSVASGVTSITGTANEITASTPTGAVTLSIPTTFDVPGDINILQANSGGTAGILGFNSNAWQVYTAGGSNNFFITAGDNLAAINGNDNYNIGIGQGAMANLQGKTATYNIAIGYDACNTIYNSYGNVGIGYQTLEVSGGSYNVAIGHSALNTLAGNSSSHGYCIGIGYQAGTNQSGNITSDSNIYLNSAGGGSPESNTLRIGNGTGTSTQQLNAAYISGIYGASPSGTINVALIDSNDQLGSIATSTAGFVLTSNGSGLAPSFQATTADVNVITYVSINHAQSPYTALTTDYYISCNVTGGVITVKLPNAPATGRVFIIKDQLGLSPTSNITVTTVGGTATLDGVTSYIMNTAYEVAQFVFNGTNFEIF